MISGFSQMVLREITGGIINMKKRVLNSKLINKIEDNGYCVTDYKNGSFYFSKYSPAGQDFGFEVEGEDLDELASNIYKYYDDFDVSYEAYLWLDDTGHGINGAPYDMKDLYEDMQACEDFIIELYEIIKEED